MVSDDGKFSHTYQLLVNAQLESVCLGLINAWKKILNQYHLVVEDSLSKKW